MKILPAFMALSAITLAACGTTGAASTASSSATPTPSGRGFGGGTAGQLVKLNGQTLTLSTSSGDVQVVYTTSTTITQTSTVSAADIASGLCVVITGTKDSSGAITARSVRLSQPVNGTCTQGPGGGGPGIGRPPGGAVPSGAARPSPNPNAAFVVGLVTDVSGVSVTVKAPTTSTTTTVTVPTTVTVAESSAATASDLTIDSCVVARGQKNTQGVVQATSLNITPANSSGKCTTGGGRFPGGGGFSGTPPANPGTGVGA